MKKHFHIVAIDEQSQTVHQCITRNYKTARGAMKALANHAGFEQATLTPHEVPEMGFYEREAYEDDLIDATKKRYPYFTVITYVGIEPGRDSYMTLTRDPIAQPEPSDELPWSA